MNRANTHDRLPPGEAPETAFPDPSLEVEPGSPRLTRSRGHSAQFWALFFTGTIAISSLDAAGLPALKQGGLGWSDRRFWDEPAALEERALRRFEETEFLGLFLDGPKRVRPDQLDTIPLLGVRASTVRENATLGLRSHAVLVSSRLDGLETRAALAFRQPDEPRQPSPPRSPELFPQGRTLKAFYLVLNDRIPEVTATPGPWQTVLLLFDRASNPVAIRIDESSGAQKGKRPDSRTAPRQAYPPPVSPPIDLNGNPYHPRPTSPPTPHRPSIVLTSAARVNAGAEQSWWLSGSFALPVLPRDLVRPLPGPPGSEAERKAQAAGWVDVGDPAATAVVPITILLTGDQDPAPVLLPLRVPAYGPIERNKDGLIARGHFAVDLLAQLPGQIRPQACAVWAVSRDQLSEPIVVHVSRP